MSDSDSDTEEFPFEKVEPTIPICVGIDPTICSLIFDIKHHIYNDTILSGPPDTEEAQNTDLNDKYDSIMSKIHMQLMTSFSKKGQENTGISEELKNALPENVRDKVIELNNVCFEQSNNNDKPMREQIKRLVDRQFNENSYDMGTQKI
jgi:hypothetical protein